MGDCKDGSSIVESTGYSFRRTWFGSQHPQGGSQPSITPVPRGPISSSGLTYKHANAYTYTRNKIHTSFKGVTGRYVSEILSQKEKKSSFCWAREMVQWARYLLLSLSPEFCSGNPHGGSRELSTLGCPLAFIAAGFLAHTPPHTYKVNKYKNRIIFIDLS